MEFLFHVFLLLQSRLLQQNRQWQFEGIREGQSKTPADTLFHLGRHRNVSLRILPAICDQEVWSSSGCPELGAYMANQRILGQRTRLVSVLLLHLLRGGAFHEEDPHRKTDFRFPDGHPAVFPRNKLLAVHEGQPPAHEP